MGLLNLEGETRIDIGGGNSPVGGAASLDIRPLPTTQILCNATNILLPHNRFNYIHCWNTLQYLTFQESNKALKEMFRILKPNGKMRLVVPRFSYYVESTAIIGGYYTNVYQAACGHQMHDYDVVKSVYSVESEFRQFILYAIPNATILDKSHDLYRLRKEHESEIQIILTKERF